MFRWHLLQPTKLTQNAATVKHETVQRLATAYVGFD